MTTRTIRTPPGVERGRWGLRRSALDPVGALLPILAALALWAWVLAGVLAPLGGALARLDGGGPAPVPAGCPAPAAELAAAPTADAE